MSDITWQDMARQVLQDHRGRVNETEDFVHMIVTNPTGPVSERIVIYNKRTDNVQYIERARMMPGEVIRRKVHVPPGSGLGPCAFQVAITTRGRMIARKMVDGRYDGWAIVPPDLRPMFSKHIPD